MSLYQSLTGRLQTQHEAIEPVIASVTNERLLLHPQPGKWSIKDNISHLAKYQPIFIERIHRILAEDNPVFEAYRADNDPEFADWQLWDLEKLIHRMRADRKNICTLINTLSKEQLERTGEHKKFGRLTIIQWSEFFVLHEAHHIFTIFQLANNRDL